MAIPEGNKLILELKALINKYGLEHNLTLAEAVGMIEIAKRDVIEEAIQRASAQMRAEAAKAQAEPPAEPDGPQDKRSSEETQEGTEESGA